MIPLHFTGDDELGRLGFLAAAGLVLRGDLLEVVDVVHEAAFHLVDIGVDVARDGDIDEEHGTVAAAVKDFARVDGREDLAGAGAGDDDIGAVGFGMQLLEGDDAGSDCR